MHHTGLVLRGEFETLTLVFSPALAVSSNVLRDQRDLRMQDVEPGFSIMRASPAPGKGNWHWGVGGDSRFGDYRLYPVIAWQSPVERNLQATIGFPDSTLQWQFSETWRFLTEFGPDGGEWWVRNRDFSQRSRITEERWRVRAGVEWEPVPAVTLGLSAATGFEENG